jgi:mono/diheme cytochrome c family protein
MSEENKDCCSPSNGEPTATRSTLPIWIIVITITILCLGLVFFDKKSGWFDSKVYAPYGTAEQLDAYQPKSGAAVLMAQGKKVYEMYCGSCHGNDGAGKPALAPPVAGSEWVIAKGFHRLAIIPLAGLNGPIKVKGVDWNMNMAAMGAALPDADLAAALTYMRNSWGNKASEVTADDIKTIRAEVGANPQPIQGDKLMDIAE